METLYDELKTAGCEMDNHESDLYVKASHESLRILDRFSTEKKTATFFQHQVAGERWIDIPFAFVPWWEKRFAKR